MELRDISMMEDLSSTEKTQINPQDHKKKINKMLSQIIFSLFLTLSSWIGAQVLLSSLPSYQLSLSISDPRLLISLLLDYVLPTIYSQLPAGQCKIIKEKDLCCLLLKSCHISFGKSLKGLLILRLILWLIKLGSREVRNSPVRAQLEVWQRTGQF